MPRIEGDFASLEQGAYFDGLEQYFPYVAPEPVCALDYLRRMTRFMRGFMFE